MGEPRRLGEVAQRPDLLVLEVEADELEAPRDLGVLGSWWVVHRLGVEVDVDGVSVVLGGRDVGARREGTHRSGVLGMEVGPGVPLHASGSSLGATASPWIILRYCTQGCRKLPQKSFCDDVRVMIEA